MSIGAIRSAATQSLSQLVSANQPKIQPVSSGKADVDGDNDGSTRAEGIGNRVDARA